MMEENTKIDIVLFWIKIIPISILLLGILILIFSVGLVSAYVEDDGEVYYNCNDNVLDQWYSHHASWTGGGAYSVSYPVFKINGNGSSKSCDFDGTNDYISNSNISVDMNSDLSVSMWINPDDDNSKYFFSLRKDASNNFAMRRNNPTDVMVYWYYGGVHHTVTLTGVEINASTWTNLVFVRNDSSANECSLWVNGILRDTDNCDDGIGTATIITVGQDSFGSSYFNGKIDEVKVYNEALNEEEINHIYNYGVAFNDTPAGEFLITAIDGYDSSILTNFTAWINGTDYVTTNGSVSTGILKNSTSTYTIIIESDENGGYFNKTYTSQSVNIDLIAQLFQAEASFQAYEIITNNTLIGGTYYVNGTPSTAGDQFKAGEYNISYSLAGYFNKWMMYNITPLFNGTINITEVYNSILMVNLTNAYTGNIVSSVNGWVYDNDEMVNITYSTTNNNAMIPLLKDHNYTIYAENINYSLSSDNYVNDSWNNSLYNITFSIYTNNSVYISIYDEDTFSLITSNITIVITGNTTENTYYTTSGHYFLDNLQDGQYTLKFSGGNYTLKTYILTVADRSTQNLNAYLTLETGTMTFTIMDYYSSVVIEGASMSMSRLINGSWTVVGAKNSDITGRVQFIYTPNVKYKFIITNTDYETKIFYLDPVIFDSYNVKILKTTTLDDDMDFLGVNIIYYPTSFYVNESVNFTWIILSNTGHLENYKFNISYPGGNGSYTGTNSIGEEFIHEISISSATINSRVNISYCYKSTIGINERCYTNTFSIIGVYDSGSHISIKDNTFGLSLFSRILLGTIVIFVFVGITSFFIGGLSASVVGLLIMGYLMVVEFIPLWAGLLPLVIGVIILIGRSD